MSKATIKKMGDLLTGVADALKGDPGPLVLHSWDDLPELAKKLVADNAVLLRLANHDPDCESRPSWLNMRIPELQVCDCILSDPHPGEALLAELEPLRAVVEALKREKCRCYMRVVTTCPDCGAALERVPSHRYLNDDQWDAVKAGDFFCSGSCADATTVSGKKYWRYRHLAQVHEGDPCNRCAALDALEARDGI